MGRTLNINCTDFSVGSPIMGRGDMVSVYIPVNGMDMDKFINEFIYNFSDEQLLLIRSEIDKFFKVALRYFRRVIVNRLRLRVR